MVGLLSINTKLHLANIFLKSLKEKQQLHRFFKDLKHKRNKNKRLKIKILKSEFFFEIIFIKKIN